MDAWAEDATYAFTKSQMQNIIEWVRRGEAEAAAGTAPAEGLREALERALKEHLRDPGEGGAGCWCHEARAALARHESGDK
jgi:hypothetical protein